MVMMTWMKPPIIVTPLLRLFDSLYYFIDLQLYLWIDLFVGIILLVFLFCSLWVSLPLDLLSQIWAEKYKTLLFCSDFWNGCSERLPVIRDVVVYFINIVETSWRFMTPWFPQLFDNTFLFWKNLFLLI